MEYIERRKFDIHKDGDGDGETERADNRKIVIQKNDALYIHRAL